MEKSHFHPEELRNQVTSPNGTTQAALESFTNDQLRRLLHKPHKRPRSINRTIQCIILKKG
jgi:pyrroline-5-carboxylate reductase